MVIDAMTRFGQQEEVSTKQDTDGVVNKEVDNDLIALRLAAMLEMVAAGEM